METVSATVQSVQRFISHAVSHYMYSLPDGVVAFEPMKLRETATGRKRLR